MPPPPPGASRQPLGLFYPDFKYVSLKTYMEKWNALKFLHVTVLLFCFPLLTLAQERKQDYCYYNQ